jgi:hypothetical protein
VFGFTIRAEENSIIISNIIENGSMKNCPVTSGKAKIHARIIAKT